MTPRSDRVFTGTVNFPEDIFGSAVVMGNFDGVHRGHRKVLDAALEIAKKNAKPAVVLTFEPHPRTFFRPDNPVFRLTPEPLKSELILAMGFDAVVLQPFDQSFASLSAEDFVKTHLVDNLRASHVVTGYNFFFGKGRSGDPAKLEAMSKQFGFQVSRVERQADDGGERISSTRIREALASGDIDTANRLLGYRWRVREKVVSGARLGRTLGFPTANLRLPEETKLRHGIYAVKVHLEGQLLQGVASFGRRPTFDNGAPLLETFIFDFQGDLYGKTITVEFVDWIREEVKFDSAERLVEQMHADSAAARHRLEAETDELNVAQ